MTISKGVPRNQENLLPDTTTTTVLCVTVCTVLVLKSRFTTKGQVQFTTVVVVVLVLWCGVVPTKKWNRHKNNNIHRILKLPGIIVYQV